MDQDILIKGIGEGLLVTLPQGVWEEISPRLICFVDEQEDFFRGARVALQINDLELGAGALGELRSQLSEREISLWAVLSTSKKTNSAAKNLGLALTLETPGSGKEDDIPFDTELDGDDAILIRRTIRSGQHVEYPGHVIVIGDINPGGIISAGGHIIVWGKVRGTVHAGAAGDESAIICAMEMAPTQLRIAGQIATSPAKGKNLQPEMVRIQQGTLIAETWKNGRRG
jgi:septum site-determining protein MinC